MKKILRLIICLSVLNVFLLAAQQDELAVQVGKLLSGKVPESHLAVYQNFTQQVFGLASKERSLSEEQAEYLARSVGNLPIVLGINNTVSAQRVSERLALMLVNSNLVIEAPPAWRGIEVRKRIQAKAHLVGDRIAELMMTKLKSGPTIVVNVRSLNEILESPEWKSKSIELVNGEARNNILTELIKEHARKCIASIISLLSEQIEAASDCLFVQQKVVDNSKDIILTAEAIASRVLAEFSYDGVFILPDARELRFVLKCVARDVLTDQVAISDSNKQPRRGILFDRLSDLTLSSEPWLAWNPPVIGKELPKGYLDGVRLNADPLEIAKRIHNEKKIRAQKRRGIEYALDHWCASLLPLFRATGKIQEDIVWTRLMSFKAETLARVDAGKGLEPPVADISEMGDPLIGIIFSQEYKIFPLFLDEQADVSTYKRTIMQRLTENPETKRALDGLLGWLAAETAKPETIKQSIAQERLFRLECFFDFMWSDLPVDHVNIDQASFKRHQHWSSETFVRWQKARLVEIEPTEAAAIVSKPPFDEADKILVAIYNQTLAADPLFKDQEKPNATTPSRNDLYQAHKKYVKNADESIKSLYRQVAERITDQLKLKKIPQE